MSAEKNILKGKIIRGIAGFFDVRVHDGEVYRCRARGNFRKAGVRPIVGDEVSFEITHDRDKEGNVTGLFPRKNELIRPPVANVDQALLIFAHSHPEISHYLLDRFLVMLRQKNIPAVLIFNKSDLVSASEIRKTLDIYKGAGCDILSVSVRLGTGLDELAELLLGKTSVAAGPSGVGKSSLINVLNEKACMETGELSKKIERGKNTTRHSELFDISADFFSDIVSVTDNKGKINSSYICDTPGFASLKPKNIEAADLHKYYPEFKKYENDCKFAGCTHIFEPGCAVKEALSEKKISDVRYAAYKLFFDELSGDRPVYVKKHKDSR